MNRLLRTCSAALLACALAVPAMGLETPLVVVSGGNIATINAGSGQIAIYELRDNVNTRKSVKNFLVDLQMLEARVTQVGDQTYSLVRTGWGPAKDAYPKPTPEEVIQGLFRKDPTPEQKKSGRAADQELVRKAEDEFWSKDHPYDGVVRGAFSGSMLMVVVPAKRAVLFYRSDNEQIKLLNAYNYSPALYVQLAYKSIPNPLELAKSRELDLTKEQQEELINQFKSQDENAAIQAGPSDVWCCAAGSYFVLVDSANRRVLTFEDKSKNVELRSARNISVDLMIPVGYGTTPDAARAASELTSKSKEVVAMLAEWGVKPFDQHTLKALVAMAQAGEGARKSESLQANCTGSQVVLDFTAQRKLLTYLINGPGNALQLVSARDYSFDIAIDMLASRANARVEAAEGFKAIEAMAGKGQGEQALARLKTELKFVPTLVDAAHKSAALKKLAGKDKDAFEALLAQGDKDKEAFLAQVKSAVEAAAAEREKAKKDKK